MSQDSSTNAFQRIERFCSPAPVLVVVSGPSGVGKDSVVRRMREMGVPFHFVVTATDRAPRADEVHGRDYYFWSTQEFERNLAQGEMLEHAVVYGQHKGIPRSHARQALASGSDVVMRLDVQGAETVSHLVPGAITVFIAPPSREALVGRLKRRSSDSAEQVAARLNMALAEMERMADFDYVVVNREGYLDETVQHIVAIMTAEKLRVDRHPVVL